MLFNSPPESSVNFSRKEGETLHIDDHKKWDKTRSSTEYGKRAERNRKFASKI